ncbi:sodium/proton antiporter (CPA1 family) [Allofrancisella inopinata]|uniref:Sodium:proton exchanger n=1 Tax=Allofrancisella inopinata TaxID=1085647 RepID=A0AAE6YG90_9GAMM|nr:sodium:proton antiporter [Allofrancisella inopinata]QIV95323.1 sodium:proton exchanger [Allofrancisella inopinata]TDT69090.1 sodium/proton antiporter (CPA1 family) [Allofrancisella inopinata]
MSNNIELFLHSSNYILLAAGLILLFAIVSQYLSWRLKLPSILFLILSGIILGPISEAAFPMGFKLVDGDVIFGEALSPFVSICVSIILFEGSLSLNFNKIKNVSRVVFLLVTVGLGLTVVFTAWFCHYIVGLNMELSLLIGGVTCVSGPTVVPPLMRAVRPKRHIANILKWESIIVDPIGALVVVFMLSWFVIGGSFSSEVNSIGLFIAYIIFVCVLGIVIGFIVGYLIGVSFKRHYIPEYLKSFFVLAVVVVGFIVSDSIMHGAGLLMVTVAGLVMANMKDIRMSDIVSFKENLSIVIISILFIVLSAEIDFSLVIEYWLSLIEVFIFLQFVLRPLVVYLCTFRSKTSLSERFVMGMIYPRGIVAASVAALASVKIIKTQPELYDEANTLVFFVFMIIVFTVIFQSVFAPFISKLLKVTEPEGKGFLIIGGNRFARELAEVFVKNDIEVLITDSSWTNVQKCRQLGLNTYYGSPVSVHADWSISLVGIGAMLGLSTSEYVNAVSAMKYKYEFGANNTYVLRASQKESYKGIGSIETNLATLLFDEGIDFNVLIERLNQGAKIRSTNITPNYTLENFFVDNTNAIPLFTIDSNGYVQPFFRDKKIKSESYSLVSLRDDNKNKEQLCLGV